MIIACVWNLADNKDVDERKPWNTGKNIYQKNLWINIKKNKKNGESDGYEIRSNRKIPLGEDGILKYSQKTKIESLLRQRIR